MQGNRSIKDVFQDIVANVQEIMRSEFRLARAEARQELSESAQSSILLVAGIVTGLFAQGFLLLTIMFALEIVIAPWLAALLVAIGVGIIAMALTVVGRKRMREVHAPGKTIRTVQENVQWTKQQVR
jgi:cytochrome c biogenesis protein CcdA